MRARLVLGGLGLVAGYAVEVELGVGESEGLRRWKVLLVRPIVLLDPICDREVRAAGREHQLLRVQRLADLLVAGEMAAIGVLLRQIPSQH